jgi:superfamily II DNA helicase RecQ
VLKHPDNERAVAEELFRRMEDREQKELARLSQLTALLKGQVCLWATLASYFGDAVAQCGTSCQVCLHGPVEFRGGLFAVETAKQQAFLATMERVHRVALMYLYFAVIVKALASEEISPHERVFHTKLSHLS